MKARFSSDDAIISMDKTPPPGSNTPGSSPIAELYPETTVLFADIVGFTSWSSARQPTQVFHLLESVFATFDKIAKQRGVFKVETIGDCYVAVVGLPTPRKHHAVVMSRFANDCRAAMYELTRELDTVLGPGTAELAMRFGLNSGPTTAGVLRGEKSRFQLFGDTVNTAARMESNGKPHEIQVSQKTAELLKLAGKGHWLTIRDEKVDCKGKGMLTTYWCNPRNGALSQSDGSQPESEPAEDLGADVALHSKVSCLIDWNCDLLQGVLKEVVTHRAILGGSNPKVMSERLTIQKPRDEIADFLTLPKAHHSWPARKLAVDNETPISDAVNTQLRELVVSIADRYHANGFHNFEHCSHVVMSTKKLLSRIAERAVELQSMSSANLENSMDNNICAILSHPLTEFALLLAALVHDVDHSGISNMQMVAEGDELAKTYEGQSVAEQRSIDVAWGLLTEARFAELLACLCPTPSDLVHLRQVMVHAVLATDLFDPDLKAMRESRWTKSFLSNSEPQSAVTEEDVNRRATIVLELVIQASDVSHTMQHFTVYRKWNQNLFTEVYRAYQCGRADKNPADGWRDGELGFFDHYVIPLAQKLRECGVFGVACDEFLDYAKDNRLEWEIKGHDIVQSMVMDSSVAVMTTTDAKPVSRERLEM